MSTLTHDGITLRIPRGWEAATSGGGFIMLSDGAREPTIIHVGSFPLPQERGSFGAGAVEQMTSSDIFIALFEYGPESADTALFPAGDIPRSLDPRSFDRHALQQNLPGQTGLQHNFTYRGRPFCLYVVLGSHIDRRDLVPQVNAVLATLEVV